MGNFVRFRQVCRIAVAIVSKAIYVVVRLNFIEATVHVDCRECQ